MCHGFAFSWRKAIYHYLYSFLHLNRCSQSVLGQMIWQFGRLQTDHQSTISISEPSLSTLDYNGLHCLLSLIRLICDTLTKKRRVGKSWNLIDLRSNMENQRKDSLSHKKALVSAQGTVKYERWIFPVATKLPTYEYGL